MLKNPSICLFGGTFDPIHAGHLHIAKEAVDQLQLDQLIFLPCRQSPHKLDSKFASGEHRLTMCNIAISDQEWAQVDDHDMLAPTPSYSWKTAEYFKLKFPNAKLYWLLGTDQWNALQHWDRIDYLAELLSFIVCTRGDAALVTHPFEPIILPTDHPASSTMIRNTLATDQPAQWLDQDVEQYIQQHQLYST